ncbi:MAG TPA: RICIN domain-containing protein [Streptosporangiaceae bacterium]|jgi:Ricin-type beta-trefoil lectin domain-like|nr:RICIN domain-containing protein [Streptosporangiaceae bacterium]
MRTPKRLIVTLAGLLLAAAGALTTATPASAVSIPIAGSFTNYGSGKCFGPVPGPDGNYFVNGLPIQQFSCDVGDTHGPGGWATFIVGNVTVNGQSRLAFQIINGTSGQCLDDRDGRTSDRSPVQQWTCNRTSTTMQWVRGDDLNGAWQLLNVRALQNGGSACLDVAGGSLQDGAALQLYHCTAQNTAQHFYRTNFGMPA